MFNAIGRVAVAVLLVGLPTGCAMTPEGLDVRRAEKGRAMYPTFGKPIVGGDSRWVVIPFVVQGPPGGSQFNPSSGFSSGGISSGGSYSWSGSGSGYLSTRNTHWNNLVFHDPETGASRLLLDRQAIIVESFFPDQSADRLPADVAGIFVVIADADTNHDGFINSDDASVLHRCDFSGERLTRLTPAGTQFQDFTIDPEKEHLYVRVLRDSDGNHVFDYKDEMMVLRVDLKQPGEGRPVLERDVAARALSIVAPGGGPK